MPGRLTESLSPLQPRDCLNLDWKGKSEQSILAYSTPRSGLCSPSKHYCSALSNALGSALISVGNHPSSVPPLPCLTRVYLNHLLMVIQATIATGTVTCVVIRITGNAASIVLRVGSTVYSHISENSWPCNSTQWQRYPVTLSRRFLPPMYGWWNLCPG